MINPENNWFFMRWMFSGSSYLVLILVCGLTLVFFEVDLLYKWCFIHFIQKMYACDTSFS